MNIIPFTEKYRPKTANELHQSQPIIDFINSCIEKGEIQNIILFGPPGTGKTTAIRAIARSIFGSLVNDRLVEYNASQNRGIGDVKDIISRRVKYRCSAFELDGKWIPGIKIFVLDEADLLTNEAQQGLKGVIESSKNTAFIPICNYVQEIIEPIRSRCVPIYFSKLKTEHVLNLISRINNEEKLGLSVNVIRTIALLSRGDARRSVTLTQVLHYELSMYRLKHTPIDKMNVQELSIVSQLVSEFPNPSEDDESIINILYELSGTITDKVVIRIIKILSNNPNINTINELVINLINSAYSVENSLNQFWTMVIKMKSLDTKFRLNMIKETTKCYYLIKKSCGCEYIHLMNMFLRCVY